VRVTCNRTTRSNQAGFTLMQLVVVLAVATIVTGATVMSLRAGRPSFELSNSARQLAGYLERARADSVRRRPTGGLESSVQILDATTYRVTMGFGGDSTLSSRDFQLEGDVQFITDPLTISFDWRGRPTSGSEATIALQNSSGTTQVDVTGSGDVTVGSEIFQDLAIPNINVNQEVTNDVSPDPINNPQATPTPTPPLTDENPTPEPTPPPIDDNPTPTPTPRDHGNGSPTPTPTPTPIETATPTPTPTPSPAGCAPSLSTTALTINKNGGSGSVVFHQGMTGGTVTASASSNLTITPSTTSVAANGTQTFSITSNDTSRGIFTVSFATPCGGLSVVVTVVNPN
jgi:Tfp pilus assembly protein FimT